MELGIKWFQTLVLGVDGSLTEEELLVRALQAPGNRQ